VKREKHLLLSFFIRHCEEQDLSPLRRKRMKQSQIIRHQKPALPHRLPPPLCHAERSEASIFIVILQCVLVAIPLHCVISSEGALPLF
jgi:hypothetical protein